MSCLTSKIVFDDWYSHRKFYNVQDFALLSWEVMDVLHLLEHQSHFLKWMPLYSQRNSEKIGILHGAVSPVTAGKWCRWGWADRRRDRERRSCRSVPWNSLWGIFSTEWLSCAKKSLSNFFWGRKRRNGKLAWHWILFLNLKMINTIRLYYTSLYFFWFWPWKSLVYSFRFLISVNSF